MDLILTLAFLTACFFWPPLIAVWLVIVILARAAEPDDEEIEAIERATRRAREKRRRHP